MFRFTIILCILVATACAVRAQNTIPLVFGTEPSRNTAVGSFIHDGIVYASLTDLATTFRLKTFQNSETHKLEVTTRDYTFRAAANNPFIVLFDQNRNGNVIQLHSPVLFAAGAFFVPVEEFVTVFDDAMPEEISFNSIDRSLVLGSMAPRNSASVI